MKGRGGGEGRVAIHPAFHDYHIHYYDVKINDEGVISHTRRQSYLHWHLPRINNPAIAVSLMSYSPGP